MLGNHILCVGAQKAGTSWLWSVLATHPSIRVAPWKEVHYFDFLHANTPFLPKMQLAAVRRIASDHERLGRWLLNGRPMHNARNRMMHACFHKPCDEWYHGLFESARETWSLDVTPAYSTLGDDAYAHMDRIAEAVRYLYIMRNPVDRFWSSFRMRYRKDPAALAKATKDEIVRHLRSKSVATRSDYLKMLRILTAPERKPRSLLLYYEDIAANPRSFIESILAWLQLPVAGIRDDELFGSVNVSPKNDMPGDIRAICQEHYASMLRTLRLEGVTHPNWEADHASGEPTKSAGDSRIASAPALQSEYRDGKTPSPGCAMVCAVKDEGAYVFEHYAWYKHIGFTKFIYAYNDCTDQTVAALETLKRHDPQVVAFQNVVPTGGKPQHTAYKHIYQTILPSLQNWHIFVCDIDEFLLLRQSATIQELLATFDYPDAVSFNWRIFGSNGHKRYDNDLVVNRFTACSVESFRRNREFKTIWRNTEGIAMIGIHRPRLKPDWLDSLRWIYASGPPQGIHVPTELRNAGNGWRHSSGPYLDIAQINHYAVKSAEEFLAKRKRGNGNPVPDTVDRFSDAYFSEYDRNETVDTLAASASPVISAEVAALRNKFATEHGCELMFRPPTIATTSA